MIDPSALTRDRESNAVLVTKNSELRNYRETKQIMASKNQRMTALEERLETLERTLSRMMEAGIGNQSS